MLSYFLATNFLQVVLLITQSLAFDAAFENDASCPVPTNLDGELLINGTIHIVDTTIAVLPGGSISLLCHAEQKALCLDTGIWSMEMGNCSTMQRSPLSDDHLQRWLSSRVTMVNQVDTEIPSDQFICELEEPTDAIYTITDGQINQAGFVTAGSKIRMICDNPTDIIRYGSDISECLDDGYLTEEFGICKRSRRRTTTTTEATTTAITHCHVPDINGAVMKSVEVGIGESFTVTCFSDYFVHASNNESVMCKENGFFEPPLGRCVTKSIIYAVQNRLHDDLSILIKDYLPNEMVDIDEQDVDGWTALMWAVTLDDLWSFQMLLNNSANCNILNNANSSALLFAAKNGNIAMVRTLIDIGATINQTNIYGLSPLHVAIRQFHLAVAEILIQVSKVNTGVFFSL